MTKSNKTVKMWQSTCVLLILMNSLVFCEVCIKNTEYSCNCKFLIDEKTEVPVYLADCSEKNFDTIPTQLESEVNFLDLSLNKINILDSKLQKLDTRNLHVLILKLNRINSIDQEFFLSLPNLRELDLSYNFITTLENEHIFQNLNKLVRLNLSFNQIKQLPSGIFKPLHHIRFLHLGYNPMGNFIMKSKMVLNQDLMVNNNLTHLNLDGMNITELHSAYFDDFKKMVSLSLADNYFQDIPTVPYSLEKLDLSGNWIKYLSARYLNYQSLKVLKLNRMSTLTEIHHYAFYNLYHLEKLYINDCPNLKTFSELAFDVAPKNFKLHPKFLYLARNGLSTLNETYKYFFKNMHHVDLRHNPWRCNCDILWLKEFENVLYNQHEIRCSKPPALRNKNVLQLGEEDLVDCYPEIYGKKSHRILIVILGCAIVVLFGLIFILLRYPSNGFLTNSRLIGPSSPYNLASTNDQI